MLAHLKISATWSKQNYEQLVQADLAAKIIRWEETNIVKSSWISLYWTGSIIIHMLMEEQKFYHLENDNADKNNWIISNEWPGSWNVIGSSERSCKAMKAI